MPIYQKIMNYIKENGIKQIAISRKTGISMSSLNATLNGKRRLYAEEFREICVALKVSANKFL